LLFFQTSSTVDDAFQNFQQFTADFKKKFTTISDFSKKFDSFKVNNDRVVSLNAKNKAGEIFGQTIFSDMDPADFKKTYLNFNVQDANKTIAAVNNNNDIQNKIAALKAQIDALTKGIAEVSRCTISNSLRWKKSKKLGCRPFSLRLENYWRSEPN